MNDKNFLLSTDFNNQKQYINNTTPVSVPPYAGVLTTVTIPHSLGYIPAARVWYSQASGGIYPLSNNQLGGTGVGFQGVTGDFYLTTTDLVISLFNATAGSINVTLYSRIYLDD